MRGDSINFCEFFKELNNQNTELHNAGARTMLVIDEGATDAQLAEVEKMLDISLPDDLKEILKLSKKIYWYWTLFGKTIIPSDFEQIKGTFSINLEEIEFFTAPLVKIKVRRLLKIAKSIDGEDIIYDLKEGSIYCFNYYHNQLFQMANSLEAYLAITIQNKGLAMWNYGLIGNKELKESAFEFIREFLKPLVSDPDAVEIVNYACIHGAEEIISKGLPNEEDVGRVFTEIMHRLDADLNHFKGYNDLIIELCPAYAKKWIISLWVSKKYEKIADFIYLRAYFTGKALPAKEALKLISETIPDRASGKDVYRMLSTIGDSAIIDWMQDKVNYPLGDWVNLFLESQPTKEQVFSWLEGDIIYQETVCLALKNLSKESELLKTYTKEEKMKLFILLLGVNHNCLFKKDKEEIIRAIRLIIKKFFIE